MKHEKVEWKNLKIAQPKLVKQECSEVSGWSLCLTTWVNLIMGN